jgi:SAM-dependent methyltransferase
MTANLYAQYREPFAPKFFAKAAAAMQLSQNDRLLDIACGTGALALGFAPYVGALTGLDPDAQALDFVRAEAARNGINIELIHAGIEDMPEDLGPFDVVTVGRAHAQLPRDHTLAQLDALVSARGKVLICRTFTDDGLSGRWAKQYRAVGRRWGRRKAALTSVEFMADSPFVLIDGLEFRWRRTVSVDDLLLRALSYSGTTADKLGPDKDRFLAELCAAITPYSSLGAVDEVILTMGYVFARQGAQNSAL